MKGKKGEVLTVIKPGYRVNFIKPCVADRKKKTAEATLNVKLDMDRIHKKIKDRYSNTLFSKELGMVRVTFNTKYLLLFDSGRIIVRKARDEKDAVEAIEEVAGLVGS